MCAVLPPQTLRSDRSGESLKIFSLVELLIFTIGEETLSKAMNLFHKYFHLSFLLTPSALGVTAAETEARPSQASSSPVTSTGKM